MPIREVKLNLRHKFNTKRLRRIVQYRRNRLLAQAGGDCNSFFANCCNCCSDCTNVNCNCCSITGGTVDATLSSITCAGVNQTITLNWTNSLTIAGGVFSGQSGFETYVTVGTCVWTLAFWCFDNEWNAYLETPYAGSNTTTSFSCNTLSGSSTHNNVYWSTCYGADISDPLCNNITVEISYDASNVEIDPLYNQCCNQGCTCSLPLFSGFGGCMITFEQTTPGVFLADATHGFVAFGDPQGTYTITYDCNTCDGSIVYDGFYGNINETGNTCIDAGGGVALAFTLGTISCS